MNAEYLIIADSDIQKLQVSVNNAIRRWFIPAGGIVYIPATPMGASEQFLQAMYKPKPEVL